MTNFERDQLLAGAFHAITDKIKADILHIAKKWIKWRNESSCKKYTFSKRFQLLMPVLHQSMYTFEAGLWSLEKI